MAIVYNASTVREGLVLHLDAANPKSYPGSGTVWRDLSGLENNGTLTNGVGYSASNKGLLAWDGVNDYVTCGNSPSFNLSNFTASVWVRPNNVTSRNNILSKEQTANWVVAVGAAANKVTFWIYNGQWRQQNSVSNIAVSEWVYITATYDNAVKLLYLNGSLDSQQSAANMILNSATPLAVGASGQSFSSFLLNGNIASVALYSRVLTAAEIRQNFEATRGRYGI